MTVHQLIKAQLIIFLFAVAACTSGLKTSPSDTGSYSTTSSRANSASSSSRSPSGSSSGEKSGNTTLPGRVIATEFADAFDRDKQNQGDCDLDGPVDTDISSDTIGGTCTVSRTESGEWLSYTVEVASTQKMDVAFRVATNKNARAFKLMLNTRILGVVNVFGDNDGTWQTVNLHAVTFPAGRHELRVVWMTGDIHLNFMAFSAHQPGGHSASLWGRNGENHDAGGFLSDWSYAGYHYGEDAPPVKTPTSSITQFGAIANDGNDDTAAFKAALNNAVYGDVVAVPAGRFILAEEIEMPNGVVLQGAGSENTTLYVPTNLVDVAGIDPSFNGGFIYMKGTAADGAQLANITQPARRGERQVVVSSAAGLAVGQWIQVQQSDIGGNLVLESFYAGFTAGLEDYSDLSGDAEMEFFSRITRIEQNILTLERPLPVNVDPGYTAELHSYTRPYAEVGIEGLTIEFPPSAYPGHFNEVGYNAIDIRAQHSWVRDVVVKNMDYGINLRDSHFVSILDFTVINKDGRSGHHGISVGRSTDCLIQGFDIQAELVHDLTLEWYAHSNVFTQGRGDNLTLDHHRASPYANLFTQVHLGKGTRPWLTGGRNDRGYKTAAYSTFWNMTAEQDIAWPEHNFGPRMVFVGVPTKGSHSSDLDWWVENIRPEEIYPPNLWLSQREKRLGVQ